MVDKDREMIFKILHLFTFLKYSWDPEIMKEQFLSWFFLANSTGQVVELGKVEISQVLIPQYIRSILFVGILLVIGIVAPRQHKVDLDI